MWWACVPQCSGLPEIDKVPNVRNQLASHAVSGATAGLPSSVPLSSRDLIQFPPTGLLTFKRVARVVDNSDALN